MYTSQYSVAVELLRLYLAEQGPVTIESFSDSHSTFSLNGRLVMLSLNDPETVTIKFGKEPAFYAITLELAQFSPDLPTENIPASLVTRFGQYVNSELRDKGYDPEKEAPPQERTVPGEKKDALERDSLMEGIKSGREDEGRDTRRDSGRKIEREGRDVAGSGNTFIRPPDMPDFEDEYEVRGKSRFDPPSFNPSIGDSDLHPAGLGGDPGLKPYLDPLAANPHGGMYPDLNHPIFGERRGNTSRTGVPPGARYDDPYGEDNLEDMGMGLPGNMRNTGGRNANFGGPGLGGPGGGFGGFT